MVRHAAGRKRSFETLERSLHGRYSLRNMGMRRHAARPNIATEYDGGLIGPEPDE